jgi:sugar (pentulose or hexulose) kinase
MYIIGLDLGTTHIKAVLVNEAFEITAVHVENNKKFHSKEKGWYYDPEALWNCALSCIKNIALRVNTHEIAAVAVTSMAEAGLPLDSEGEAIYPIIPWNDMRGTKHLNKLESMIGTYELYKKTGLISHPKYSLSKIMWFKENHPELFSKTKVWLSVADYVVYKLSGELVTDSTLASRTMLYNINDKVWDSDLTKFIGGEAILPRVMSLGSAVGTVKEELAGAAGLNPETKVIIAGHDHLSAAIAVGINSENEVLDSMGTSEVFVGSEDIPNLSYESYKLGFNHGCFVDDKYYWMTSMPASGASVEWLKNLLSLKEEIPYDVFTDIEKYIEPSSLFYYPYLNGSGTPHVDCTKRGVFMGLSSDTDIYEMIKGIYEGTSYEARWIIESVEKVRKQKVRKIKVVGGAVKNIPWIKTKCNVIGKNIICSSISEASAAGAAILAAKSIGLISDYSDITYTENGSVEFTVDNEQNNVYNNKFAQYKSIYKAFEKIYESGVYKYEDNEYKRNAKEGAN